MPVASKRKARDCAAMMLWRAGGAVVCRFNSRVTASEVQNRGTYVARYTFVSPGSGVAGREGFLNRVGYPTGTLASAATSTVLVSDSRFHSLLQ